MTAKPDAGSDVISAGDAACMAAAIEALNIPPRSGKVPLIEWFCEHCDRWYIWPHGALPRKSLWMQFKWRIT